MIIILPFKRGHKMEYKKWECIVCGWIYDEEKGHPEEGLAPGTRWKDVPIEVRRKIIPTKIIISAEKIKEGILKRLKDRLVDLGNLQKSEEERSLSSPTPSITTVMVQAAKVAAEGRHVLTFHVSQAFLRPKMTI